MFCCLETNTTCDDFWVYVFLLSFFVLLLLLLLLLVLLLMLLLLCGVDLWLLD